MPRRSRAPSCVLLATALLLPAAAMAETRTAVHCERLFDARSGRVLGEHTIVVADGRIAEVIPGRAKLEDGVESIVLGDRTCSPGWTDLHVHLGSESSPASYSEGFRLDPVDFAFRAVGYADKTLRAGFTTVRDLGGEDPRARYQALVDRVTQVRAHFAAEIAHGGEAVSYTHLTLPTILRV